MTREQTEGMYGDIPFERFIPHNWRKDVVKLGEVPAEYMEKISEGSWREAVEDTVLAMDPLEPDAIQGVLLPNRGLGWLRVHPAFPGPKQAMLRLDLDAALTDGLPDSFAAGARESEALERRLLREAVSWLARAKTHHDLIEELYRPAVDFAAVTRETELLCRELFTES